MALYDPDSLQKYYAGVVVVSLVCVHYVAHRNQAIRLAGATLPQPSPPKKKEGPPPSRARRIAGAALHMLIFAVLFAAPSVIMNYVLPRIASQNVVDGFALTFAAGFTFFLNGGAWTLLEGGVQWTWGEDAKFPTLNVTALPPGRSDWTIAGFSAILTSAFVAAQYYGYEVFSCVMVAPILIACNVNANRYSVKRLCKLITIGLAAAVGLVAIIFGGAYLWTTYMSSPSEDKADEPKKDIKLPSAWIASMFLPMMMSIPFSIVMMFMTVTLRFEASQADRVELKSAPELLYEEGKEDKPLVAIGRHHVNPEKPLFIAGMVSIILTAAGMFTAMLQFGSKEAMNVCALQLGLQACNLTVPAGIAYTAWRLGKFKEWYNFDEKSLYRGEEHDRQAMDDVEKLLDEKK